MSGECEHCWVCDRWRRVRFVWRPGVSGLEGGDARAPVCLHLSVDGFRPDLMRAASASEQRQQEALLKARPMQVRVR